MTKAVICLAKDLPSWWGECAKPRMEEYAKCCGAEFVLIEPEKWCGMMTRQMTGDYVDKYDRSLVLDADVIISREAPSIFDAYPASGFYMASDSEPDDPDAMRQFQLMILSQAVNGAIGWVKGYGNCGVILCNREHAPLWYNWTDYPKSTCPDQLNLNHRLRRCFGVNQPVLPREWNSFGLNTRFTMDSYTATNGDYNHIYRVPEICRDAHIVHAAGFAEPQRSDAIRLMNQIVP